MKFTVRTLLLVTAFVAIAVGGPCIYCRAVGEPIPDADETAELVIFQLLTGLWFWTPLLFAAFAVGRKRLGGWTVIAFAACEAAAIGSLALAKSLYLSGPLD